jgi:hypothetical protein
LPSHVLREHFCPFTSCVGLLCRNQKQKIVKIRLAFSTPHPFESRPTSPPALTPPLVRVSQPPVVSNPPSSPSPTSTSNTASHRHPLSCSRSRAQRRCKHWASHCVCASTGTFTHSLSHSSLVSALPVQHTGTLSTMKTAGEFRDDATTRLLSGGEKGDGVVPKLALGPYAVSQLALDAANFFIADVSLCPFFARQFAPVTQSSSRHVPPAHGHGGIASRRLLSWRGHACFRHTEPCQHRPPPSCCLSDKSHRICCVRSDTYCRENVCVCGLPCRVER